MGRGGALRLITPVYDTIPESYSAFLIVDADTALTFRAPADVCRQGPDRRAVPTAAATAPARLRPAATSAGTSRSESGCVLRQPGTMHMAGYSPGTVAASGAELTDVFR